MFLLKFRSVNLIPPHSFISDSIFNRLLIYQSTTQKCKPFSVVNSLIIILISNINVQNSNNNIQTKNSSVFFSYFWTKKTIYATHAMHLVIFFSVCSFFCLFIVYLLCIQTSYRTNFCSSNVCFKSWLISLVYDHWSHWHCTANWWYEKRRKVNLHICNLKRKWKTTNQTQITMFICFLHLLCSSWQFLNDFMIFTSFPVSGFTSMLYLNVFSHIKLT